MFNSKRLEELETELQNLRSETKKQKEMIQNICTHDTWEIKPIQPLFSGVLTYYYKYCKVCRKAEYMSEEEYYKLKKEIAVSEAKKVIELHGYTVKVTRQG